MKICNKCKESKGYSCFSKDKYKKDGLCTICKECKNKYHKIYYVDNSEGLCLASREWYSQNKERATLTRNKYRSENIEFCRSLRKKQYWENPEKAKEDNRIYSKNRAKNDDVYRFKLRCRKKIWEALKTKRYPEKSKHYHLDLLGCDAESLINHIENLFYDGMTWENYGTWHIDHIKPLALAKTCEEVKQFFNFSNLQPLWCKDNIMKGSSYEKSKSKS